MKIIIAPLSLHDAIMSQTLQSEQSAFNVSVLTLSVFKERFLSLPKLNLDLVIQALPIISNIRTHCTLLSDSLSYLNHQVNLLLFAVECHQLNISFNSLPQESDKDKDIKTVCLALAPLLTKFDSIESAVTKLSSELELWIYPHPTSALDTILVNTLLKLKARQYPISKVSSEYRIHNALNPALEAMAIAQHIVKQPTLSTRILCANPSDISSLEHAFNLYNIPFNSTLSQSSSPIISALISACEYGLNSNREHFIKCCKHNLVPHEYTPSLIKYMDIFNIPLYACDFTFNHVASTSLKSDLFTYDIDHFITLEKEAESARQHIMSVMRSWSTITWVEDVYAFLIQRKDLSFSQQSALSQIKTVCETILGSSLDSITKLTLLIHQLKTKSFSFDQPSALVSIHELSEVMVGSCDQLIIMGASAKHYPPTQKNNGLIDEPYLQKIKEYPSLSERNLALVAYEEMIFSQSPLTILSYPSASMDGKPQEIAINLKERMNDVLITPWSIHRHSINPQDKSFALSSTTSQSLFFKNKVIKGSVSSIEQFFNCSYQYFFSKGLRITKMLDSGINVAHMGTMMHFVLEEWINQSSPLMSEAFVMETLQPYVHDTNHVFPYHKETLNLIFKLLTQQMLLTIERFSVFEAATHFKPYISEYELHDELQILDSTLSFTGFVDRIDHHGNAFRIIDYKSSTKKISKDKFRLGRQIQLFTYQQLYAKKTGLTPTGVHYYTLKNDVIHVKPKYSMYFKPRIPVLKINTESNHTLFLNSAKTNSVYINPQSGEHYTTDFNRFGLTTKGLVSKNYQFIEQGVNEGLEVIFKDFVQTLLNGKIDKNPAEPSVCQYCDYQSICHFSGTYPKRDHLFKTPVILSEVETTTSEEEA
jgi:ATP-dependent helicase/nuclease subunit B